MEAANKILEIKDIFPIYGFDLLEVLFLSATVLCWGIIILIVVRIFYRGLKGVIKYECKRRENIQLK